MEKKCSKCGNSFECQQDEPSCWCSTYQKIPETDLNKDLDCLCKECLRQMYFDRLFQS